MGEGGPGEAQLLGHRGEVGQLPDLAIVNSSAGVGIADVSDPRPAADEALVAVRAFSVNRGELALLAARTNDWRPGQDIAGVVAPGGTVVIGSGNQDKTRISIYDFFGHEGARLVSYLSYVYPEPPGPDLAILASLVATRRLDPVLGLVDAWTRLPEAIQALTERRITGKAVLTIG